MFEELLIKEVQKHECLYKRNAISYTNKVIRDNAWNEVAKAVGDLKKQCQSRWRSLRDRYVKEVNKKGTLGATKWKFLDKLAFLNPHFRRRQWRKKDSEIEFVDTKTPMEMITVLYDEEPTTSRKRKLHASIGKSSDEAEEFITTSQTKAPLKIKTQPEEDDWSDNMLEEYVPTCKYKPRKINPQTEDFVITDMLEVVHSVCETTQPSRISSNIPTLQAYNSEELDKMNIPTVDDICLNMPEEIVAASKISLPHKIRAQALENSCSNVHEEDVGASKTKATRKTQVQAMDDICSLIGTVKELVAAKCTRNSSQQISRNSAFLSMLDDYLQKLNEEQQDILKVELINFVVERSAEMRENSKKIK